MRDSLETGDGCSPYPLRRRILSYELWILLFQRRQLMKQIIILRIAYLRSIKLIILPIVVFKQKTELFNPVFSIRMLFNSIKK